MKNQFKRDMNMAVLSDVYKIANENLPYVSGVKRYGLFRKKIKKITFCECDGEKFTLIFEQMKTVFGEPSYVHSFYGYIWILEDGVLSFAAEDFYNYFEVSALFLDKVPFGKKIKYEEYKKVIDTVDSFFASFGYVVESNHLGYYNSIGFVFWGRKQNDGCYIFLKEHSMNFYSFKYEEIENGQKVYPQRHKKKRVNVKNTASIKTAIISCFNEK